MHQSLRLQISRFPPTIRKAAAAASGPNGSLDSLEHLCSLMPYMTRVNAGRLLPVFYSHLDSAGIPTPAEMDAPRMSLDRVAKAMSALKALYSINIHIPYPAGPDVWPRVWHWARFLRTFREQILELNPPSEAEMCLDFLLFCGYFLSHNPTSELILATPGFRFMLARCWFCLSLIDTFRGWRDDVGMGFRDAATSDLSRYLRRLNATPAFLEEFSEGAGGSISDLASIVIQYFDFLVYPDSTPLPPTNVDSLCGVLLFIHDTDETLNGGGKGNLQMGALCTELLKHGIEWTLTRTLLALTRTSTSDTGPAVQTCLILMQRMFTTMPGAAFLPNALTHGLLRALVSFATHDIADGIHFHLNRLLTRTIPAATVNYYLLNDLSIGVIDDVEDIVDTDGFRNSRLFPAWESFLALARERLEVFESVDLREYSTFKACDNMQCGMIEEKSAFSYCSRCQSVFYCSKQCQAADWRAGHRQSCKGERFRCLDQEECYLDHREKKYFRALLDHDYDANKPEIYSQLVRAMHRDPGNPHVTFFDYTKGALRVEVISNISESPLYEQLNRSPGEWVDHVSRAKASKGRLHLHVMQVVHANRHGVWVVPLRTVSSHAFEELKRIASSLPPDEGAWDLSELDGSIRTLVRDEKSRETVEIH
ncbi:hypothetical protein C8R43DRAFT_555901 [Mycena crocata]|nr:hypothetical protein C8R43DRAFT_555901 [Mycena crocata]